MLLRYIKRSTQLHAGSKSTPPCTAMLEYSSTQEEELKDTCLLVFANKQDLPGALSSAQVSEALGLTLLKNRQWSIFSVNTS
jgi:signal recognition particle receptor subunit beta